MNRPPFHKLILALTLIVYAASAASAASHARLLQAASTDSRAKYIFLFIGDGMGAAQRAAAELYLTTMRGAPLQARTSPLRMNSFPAQGLTNTLALDSVTTDSAAAATAIASGQKTLPGVIGMDSHKLVKLPTLAEIAKGRGMRVGIVTTVPINHATPAAFYAHVPSRTDYYAIGQNLARSSFDYYAGGRFLQESGVSGDEPALSELAREAGYTLVGDKAGLQSLLPGGGKILALAQRTEDENSLYYALDRTPSDLSLVDFTRKGIQLLDNPDGFLMVVEGGKIDWAAHANDAATLLGEVLDLDATIGEAVSFYNSHPTETLIIVTSDHDTGGMNLFFAGSAYGVRISRLAAQQSSFHELAGQVAGYREANPAVSFEESQAWIDSTFGAFAWTARDQAALTGAYDLSMQSVEKRGDDEYGNYDPLTAEVTARLAYTAGILWTDGSHTRLPVQTSALGAGSELFNGVYENTEIFYKIMAAAGF